MTDCRQTVNNPVQGVQGVQGAFCHTLHRYMPRCARLCAVLCRVCRVYARGRVRKNFFYSIYKNTNNALSRESYPAHPAHPAQATPFVLYSCAGYFSHPAHPAQLLILLKKMKKLICGKENVEAFRAEIKAATPDFYTLAKELYTAGMISGLRGATLEYLPLEENMVEEEKPESPQQHCEECRHWRRDKVGDGLGIGDCLRNVRPDLMKWPRREACTQFEAAV